MGAVATEHILLASDDDLSELAPLQPGKVRRRFIVNHRIRRSRTELTVYEDGYFGVRHWRRNSSGPESLVDLRFIDPRPVLSRFVAKGALRTAACFIGAAAVVGALGHLLGLPAMLLAAPVASLAVAALALMRFLYRTQEQVTFLTRHGRVAVLTLIAGFGSVRACRALVPELVECIRRAGASADGDRNRGLRNEIREHYRLLENGTIGRDDCMAAVQRILGRFE